MSETVVPFDNIGSSLPGLKIVIEIRDTTVCVFMQQWPEYYLIKFIPNISS